MKEDLLSGELIVAEGRGEFVETISEFDMTHADARLLDVLSCQGCYAGAGMTTEETMLQRRTRVSNYAKNRLAGFSAGETAEVLGAAERYRSVDFSRDYYSSEEITSDLAAPGELQEILHRMGKFRPEDFLNCGACGYDTCIDHAHAVHAGLADSEMCLPHTIEQLRYAYKDLEESHRSLEETKEALERSGKLASMGQLAAGIAHEVNNPLGTLLLHANLLLEECSDGSQTRQDLETIVDQANRCKRIISGLLNFARQSRVVLQPTDLAELVEKVVRMVPAADNVTVEVTNELSDPVAEIDADQIVQVLTNLFSNAQHAMPRGGLLSVKLSDTPESVNIQVSDTGEGIAHEHMTKLFDPFFTTKQVGMGTGLGLAVTHGIVKMHRGNISVDSNADPIAGPTGSIFRVTLPRHEGSSTVEAHAHERSTRDFRESAGPAESFLAGPTARTDAEDVLARATRGEG
jgi:two-component system NtrC family sensor kinase